MDNYKIEINAFGKFQVKINDIDVFDNFCRSEKAKEVFRYLLLFKDTKISKEKLLDMFWPGMPLEKAYQNLNSTVYLIRNTFDKVLKKGIGKSIVKSSNQMLWIVLPEDCYYDVEEFKKYIDLAIHEHDEQKRIDYCKKAIDIYKGDMFIEDEYSEWSASFREEYRELLINTLILLVETLYKLKKFDECMYYILKILEIDKYNESAAYYKLSVLISKGLYNQALKFYDEFVTLLKTELEISPPANLKLLYHKIKTQIESENSSKSESEIPNVLNAEEFKKILKIESKKRKTDSSLIEILIENGLITREKILDELLSKLRGSDIISMIGNRIYVLLSGLSNKEESEKIVRRLKEKLNLKGASLSLKNISLNKAVETLHDFT
ncbi:MAG: hypothetical protein PWQ20_331 [Thermotogaceae bacterium]|nr:hypothetical protein [Thermotogaceae bacterium]MDN5337261.1 hypothetical protein [Thermotogaceae bacterium]